MGELALAASRPADSRARHEQARDIIASRAAVPPEQARALEGIARADLAAGQREAAAAGLRQALAIYQRIGHPRAQRVAETLDEFA